MSISAEVLLDSIGPNGIRITTFKVEFWKLLLAEFNTHRVLSRNWASTRAIPTAKIIEQVVSNPFIPVNWGKNQKGMSASVELTPQEIEIAKEEWLFARNDAVDHALRLIEIGLHKQISGRILEPWMLAKGVVTATDWDNFFHLRNDPEHAQPEFALLAKLMFEARNASNPVKLSAGQWHLPFIKPEEYAIHTTETLLKLSSARCCRVSYNNLDNSAPDINKDIFLHDSLIRDMHMSPMEHQAMAVTDPHLKSGNINGWVQYRKTIPNECYYVEL